MPRSERAEAGATWLRVHQLHAGVVHSLPPGCGCVAVATGYQTPCGVQHLGSDPVRCRVQALFTNRYEHKNRNEFRDPYEHIPPSFLRWWTWGWSCWLRWSWRTGAESWRFWAGGTRGIGGLYRYVSTYSNNSSENMYLIFKQILSLCWDVIIDLSPAREYVAVCRAVIWDTSLIQLQFDYSTFVNLVYNRSTKINSNRILSGHSCFNSLKISI